MNPEKEDKSTENGKFFFGKGINGNTLISDRNGLKSIEKIFETQNINSLNTFTGIETPIKVVKGDLEPSIKITTTLGYVIEGSHNQLIMTRNEEGKYEWKLLSQIKESDHITMQIGNECGRDSVLSVNFILNNNGYKPCTIPKDIDEDICYILGLLVGDGCYSKNHDDYMVEYCSDDAELLEIYQKIVKEKFDIKCGTYYRNETFGKAYFCRKKVRDFLFNCGIKYVTAREKEVPWVVLQNTLDCQRAFLRGLYDTDGGVNGTCVHFTTASTFLASQVHTMLLNLGIVSTRSYTKSTDSWRISIYGRAGVKYSEQIGFYCNRKRELINKKYPEMKTKVPKSNTNEIPGGREMGKKLKKEILNRGEMGEMGEMRTLLGTIIRGNGKLRYNHLSYIIEQVRNIGEMGDVGNEILFMNKNGILFDTVKNISFGECVMYDFKIEESKTFIGNGIVNCASLEV